MHLVSCNYNPIVGIKTELLSPPKLYADFNHEWRYVQFNINNERQIWNNWGNFIYYQIFFYQKTAERKAVVMIIWDSNIPNGNITIFSDCQAAIRALGSNVMNSKTVYGFRKYLNEVAKKYNVHIVWVPEHNDIPGNCRADELARRSTTIGESNTPSNSWVLETLWGTAKLIIDDEITDYSNSRWAVSVNGRMALDLGTAG